MATAYAGTFAFRTSSGTVYRYGSRGELQMDVEKTMKAERLIRQIHASPSWMTRVAAAVSTFALVLGITLHIATSAAAPPSPNHSVLAQSIIAHNVATERCLADTSTCGDTP